MNGWIAELGTSQFAHYFGGDGWAVKDPDEIAGGPTVILDFDLRDPAFNILSINSVARVPMCSYMNCDLWVHPQHFQVLPEDGSVTLLQRSDLYTIELPENLKYPNPLPIRPLSLRPITTEEMKEDAGVNAFDSFLGGESFIRVLGEPTWLQQPEQPLCMCGRKGVYVCSIGYESYTGSGSFVDDRPFFIGEAALYFFVCRDCLIVTVISQSS